MTNETLCDSVVFIKDTGVIPGLSIDSITNYKQRKTELTNTQMLDKSWTDYRAHTKLGLSANIDGCCNRSITFTITLQYIITDVFSWDLDVRFAFCLAI